MASHPNFERPDRIFRGLLSAPYGTVPKTPVSVSSVAVVRCGGSMVLVRRRGGGESPSHAFLIMRSVVLVLSRHFLKQC